MSVPRLYKTEAIVLKRSDLGEADRILTLYTPQLGKTRVVAKGVRKTTSRLAGHLELFSHASLLIARARNLDVVTQGETIESFLAVRDDLLRASCALHAVELVDRFTEEHIENYPLFKLLADVLSWLGTGSHLDATLLFFDVRLLQHVGYRPELHHCVNCRNLLTPITNFFSSAAGGMLCPTCAWPDKLARPLSVNALKALRFVQDREHAEAIRLKLTDSERSEVDSVLRNYIRYLLERDLKSTQFLDLVRKQA